MSENDDIPDFPKLDLSKFDLGPREREEVVRMSTAEDDNPGGIPSYIREFLVKGKPNPLLGGGFATPESIPTPDLSLYEIEWSDGTKEIFEAHSVMMQGGHGMPFPVITFGRIDPNKVRTDSSDGGDFVKILPLTPNPGKMVIQVTRLEVQDNEIPRPE